jgi:quercetin dioxygenase-like cupin family protein
VNQLLSSYIKQSGNLKITVYEFEKAGDKLPMHSHDETTWHDTFVGAGAVRCTNGIWTKEGSLGTYWQFDAGQHEFEALEDGTRIFNIRK